MVPRAALSHNACALAKFERPKNACVFEGGRIWSSPHGRARAQARSSRGRDPEEPPRGGGDAALTRLLYEGPHFARAAEDSIVVLDLVMHIFA